MKAKSDLEEQLIKVHANSFLTKGQKIQIYYDTQITAKIKKQQKVILQRQSGLIPAQTFTAILGPSGSGKTTLLNFLSGRLMSDNLIVEGQIQFNGKNIKSVDPYSNQIGYVMQEDALLGTLTPRQCFRFACNLRVNASTQEKIKIVEDLINELGLSSCAEVKVGNTFIKGISGGERKRTSIGVELITNPGVIFLDEPTTGLDSTTALQVILLLKKLALEGKTIISTIHQPSSQLFCEFDRLMLLVDGKCIYLGSSQDAYDHFETQGYKCPQLMNASEFYLDMMSITEAEDLKEGQNYDEAKEKHDKKILSFEQAYHNSKFHDFKLNPDLDPVQIQKKGQISLFYQMYLILHRALICQIRNPMDVFFKIVQAVFTSLIVLLVFGYIGPIDLVNKKQKYQNIRGVLFFLVASNAFGGMQGTLATFSTERPVFLRERFSKSYSTASYFIARTAINFPFELMYPSIGAIIIYWATQLGLNTAEECFKIVLVVNGVYFCAASYGLLYAALIPKLQTAMALVPVLIIPFMLLGGFFINLDDVHDVRVIFYPIMYLSPFKYGFQGGIDAVGISTIYQKRTPENIYHNMIILAGIGICLRVLSIISMQFVSNPKRPKMIKIGQLQTNSQQSAENISKQ